MSKRKEDALEKIRDEDLLELAKSVLNDSIKSVAGKRELVSIVKNSLSIEETERRLKEIKNGMAKSNSPTRTGSGHLFRAKSMLQASIIVIFAGVIIVGISDGYYNILYTSINSLPIDYQVIRSMLALLSQTHFGAVAIGVTIRTIGLALLTYWLFSSAIRASAVNHNIAGILALAGTILIVGILISTVTVVMTTPYYIIY